jgi:hypothetical protein
VALCDQNSAAEFSFSDTFRNVPQDTISVKTFSFYQSYILCSLNMAKNSGNQSADKPN